MATRDRDEGKVWGPFIKTALVWLIPALLLLPLYLVLIAISMFAGDGSLLEATEGVRGGINAALGPLLILSGVAVGVFTAIYAGETQDWISGGLAVVITVGAGVVLGQRALAQLRKAAT
ncbi:hypothetical protein ENSA5_39580 [Enhygromyxa salina]|uniref:Uncharacterized protein n=1 Tax=Enhygromyxa salina TaxID=215803 RepID=A0A2S9XR87_9BACT|nr:hypothetical protein [Enhygromyxa salina]PRP95373.1 hypothetical protein ENSA5_39580 [Enhygromyxa salina]